MNIKIYLYNKEDKKFSHIMGGHAFLVTEYIDEHLDYTLTPPPDNSHVWRWIDSEWVADALIEKPLEELQDIAWSNIKAKRSEVLVSGVLVESVDKVFQTDNDSMIQYSSIAGMIALDNYVPINWKTVDNTYIELTVDLFKELQQSININTQHLFKVAEDHKTEMLKLKNPSEYNYSDGWD